MVAYDLNVFTAVGIDTQPLHLLKSGVDGPNGVYNYTSGGATGFPSTANTDANYGVDVVFTQSAVNTATPSRTSTPAPTNTPTQTSTPIPTSTFTPNPSPSPTSIPLGTPTATCPCMVLGGSPMSSTYNTVPLEVGVKLRADRPGSVSAIRFYKAPGESGPHRVSLWSKAGALLATATSSAETASGWQTVDLPSPVSISSNTTYVASYHTNGQFAYTVNAFTASGMDVPPLHLLQAGVDGPNGVYAYVPGGASAFPSLPNQDTNYGVDVLFN